MDIEREVDYLKSHLSLQLHSLLPPERCAEIIARYDDAQAAGRIDDVIKELIDECREQVFTDQINTLLVSYFQGPYQLCWSSFDVVGPEDSSYNGNALWHLDYGINGTHKLFIYLNPVAEHGGNTVMVDLERTNKLRQAGALPLEEVKRKEDLSDVFEELRISSEIQAYDLKAGDGLLFDPLTLAHRCQPTKAEKRRYTICYTVAPSPSFQNSFSRP